MVPIPSARTGGGDPARTLQLLWRDPAAGPRHGPRQGLTVDQVIAAATALADAEGLDAVTMRRVTPQQLQSAGRVAAAGARRRNWITSRPLYGVLCT